MDKNCKIGFDDYHIHTKMTDGVCTPKEIIEEAIKLGMRNIAFTEHVREALTYNWFRFRDDILDLRLDGIKIWIGIEAKVLNPEGKLDVSKDVLESADIVLGTVHGAQRVEWLLNSDCDIIAHPQLDLLNVERFLGCDKILELNSRHPLDDEIISKLVEDKKNRFSFGSDTHKIDDLRNGQKYFSDINRKYRIRGRLLSIP